MEWETGCTSPNRLGHFRGYRDAHNSDGLLTSAVSARKERFVPLSVPKLQLLLQVGLGPHNQSIIPPGQRGGIADISADVTCAAFTLCVVK